MEPITVTWNGPTTVEQSIEEPSESMTCGEYAAAFADAHDLDGAVYLTLDGEDVPDDAPIDLLGGETVTLRIDKPDDDAQAKTSSDVEWAGVELDDMTVKQLRAYAKHNEITLGEARAKDDIRDAIREAEKTEASVDTGSAAPTGNGGATPVTTGSSTPWPGTSNL